MKNINPEMLHYLRRFYPAQSGEKPSPYEVSLEDTRAFYAKFQPRAPELAVQSVSECHIPSGNHLLPGRVYTPEGKGPFPIIVHYHGGGYCFGSLDTHDAQCRHLCQHSECIVVAVDYRLAPEHKFPAAQDDAYAALLWAHGHANSFGGNASKIALAGDSAGGGLVITTACRSRDLNGPRVSFLLPVVPGVKIEFDEEDVAAADGITLDKSRIAWFVDMMFHEGQDLLHPEIDILGSQDLSNLPPTLVLTAEFDLVRPSAEKLVDKLRLAGNDVEYMCAERMTHAFFSLVHMIPAARPFMERSASVIKNALYD